MFQVKSLKYNVLSSAQNILANDIPKTKKERDCM